MKAACSEASRTNRAKVRCAIYTRVSTDQGLDQEFNSLDAQREAAEAYIKSQAHEGWVFLKQAYDDGGYSGGSLERPALQTLLADIQQNKLDVIIVYKVDRLTRSLADFAKLVELFDANNVSFVSVTQSFNTTSSMGRLTLNVLLSYSASLSGAGPKTGWAFRPRSSLLSPALSSAMSTGHKPGRIVNFDQNTL